MSQLETPATRESGTPGSARVRREAMARRLDALANRIAASQRKAAELNLGTRLTEASRDTCGDFYKVFSLELRKWPPASWGYVELARRVAQFYLAMRGVSCDLDDPHLWRLLGGFDINPRKSVMETDDPSIRPLGVTMGTIQYSPGACEEMMTCDPVPLREIHALLFNVLMADEEVFWGGIRRIAEGDPGLADAARRTRFSFDHLEEVRARCVAPRFNPKEPPLGWVYLHLWSHRLRSRDEMLRAFGPECEPAWQERREALERSCPIVKHILRMDEAWRAVYDGWSVADGVPPLSPRELAYLHGDRLPVGAAGGGGPGRIWIVGRMSYTAADSVVPHVNKSFKQQLIDNDMAFVPDGLVGISSTTDLFLIAARYMGFTTNELYLLQLSLLATTLMVCDHTVFEIVASAHAHGLTFPVEGRNVTDFFGSLIPETVALGPRTTSNAAWKAFLERAIPHPRPQFRLA